jgi:cyclic pyranopterin phosphate synthase
MPELTHVDREGAVRMVDVTDKDVTRREAVAAGEIRVRPDTIRMITRGETPKGNVLETARIAGVMAAKRTSELIPLCHPLSVTGVDLDFDVGRDRIEATARVSVSERTGVEMEALSAVCVALLTVYDMCKAVDREMVIGEVRLLEKTGGSRGPYRRKKQGRP